MQANLKVALIRHTLSPEEVVALGARLCYSKARVDDLLVDGLYIIDGGKVSSEKHWIEIEGDTVVKRMKLSNVTALTATESEALIHVNTGAKIEDFSSSAIQTEGFQNLMK